MFTWITPILFYGGAVTAYGAGLADDKLRMRHAKKWLLGLGYLALLAHGYFLYRGIDIGVGQNLGVLNLFSLALWLVASIVLLGALYKPIESLSLFVLPLAALSVLLAHAFPTPYIVDTGSDPKMLIHILLSVFAFSVLGVAGAQAVLLAIQDYGLHTKRMGGFIQKLPPLETMERLLFQMIWAGFLLLTIVFLTSFYSYYGMFTKDLWGKMVLVTLVWLIFAILLVGRHWFGWRGRRAIYGTLSGFVLLIIVYFSHQLLAEFLF